ncbi:MAG: hypothetical protein ACK48P_04440 [Holosporales bacterium]|jgi:hypothetical protein
MTPIALKMRLMEVPITTMASSDPALEQNIVQNVASYGRQLGRVVDVLNVLIATKGNVILIYSLLSNLKTPYLQ